MTTHVPKRHAGKLAALVAGKGVAPGFPTRRGLGRYNATKVEVDGYTFDSKIEARRYGELKALEKARHGERISGLKVHPEFVAIVNGVEVCRYTADFQFWKHGGPDGPRLVIEDVKSEGTRRARDWPLRKRIVEAACGITITEEIR